MSADNAIAILVTSDRMWRETENSWSNMGEDTPIWRVAHIQNPEQFDEYRHEELHNLGFWMDQTFGTAPAFKTEKEAMDVAMALYETYTIVEYGILTYDARPFNFPGH